MSETQLGAAIPMPDQDADPSLAEVYRQQIPAAHEKMDRDTLHQAAQIRAAALQASIALAGIGSTVDTDDLLERAEAFANFLETGKASSAKASH